jgi:hypothetical protein
MEVVAPGWRPTQFRNVKIGIDVNRPTSFARGRWASAMRVNRNVIFGLLAHIAIGFVALIVGDLLH